MELNADRLHVDCYWYALAIVIHIIIAFIFIFYYVLFFYIINFVYLVYDFRFK